MKSKCKQQYCQQIVLTPHRITQAMPLLHADLCNVGCEVEWFR